MTDISETPGQELPEYLRYEDALTLPTGIDAETLNPFVFPEDPDEETLILFKMSQRQFTAILSSVDTGSIICYGAGAMQVYWWFLRNVEMKMSICEAIIDCITNDIDTQQALVNMLMGNQTFNNYLDDKISTLTQELISTKLITGACDRPVLAGKIKALVDAMDKANNDWFEKIETGTNSEEKFALVVGAIPGLETLPIDDVVDFAQDILEDFTEEYSAQVDGALLQEWYCGLLCVAEKNADCSLSWGEIYDYFAKRVQSGLNPFSTLSDVVSFIVTGEYSGTTPIADATMALQTGLMVTQRSYFGSTLPSISYVTRDAPTSTFYEDCDICPEDDLWLTALLAAPNDIELVSQDEDTQVWTLHNGYTGNYLTGGAISSNGTPFYILDVDITGTPGAVARFVLDYGTYPLNDVPCYYPTTKIWCYEVNAGVDITVTISRQICPYVNISFGLGTVISQSATQFVVGSTLSGAHQIYSELDANVKFRVDSVVYDPPPPAIGTSYFNAAGVNVPGVIPPGTEITGVVTNSTIYTTVTITGELLPR